MPPAAASLRPVVVCFVAALVLLLVPVSGIAQSPQDSPVVRISQVYGSGGGSTSPYGCDFVELFNSSSQPVELAGWSVQTYSDRWYVFRPGTIKIPGSSYYLLAKQPCADGKRPSVPTPDYAAVISVNPGQGRVALVRNEEVISGKSDPDVVDFVGYGSAPEYEGSGPAPASANTLSPQRKDGGCRDQDDNKTDFEALTPLARNTAAPQHACPDVAPLVQSVNPPDGSGGVATDGNLTIAFSEPVALSGDWFRIECDLRADLTPGNAAVTGGPAVFTVDPHEDLFGDDTCVLTVYAEGVKDQDAGDPPDLMENDYHSGFTTAAGACGDRAYPIHDLQGRSAVSPVNGLTRTVEGVVTGDFQGANGLGGFFMEEEAADQDGDAETSEGILARDGDAALLDVSAGRRVRVTGRVTEIDGNTALAALTRVSDCGESEMPAAVAVEFPAPAADGWERVEGMRVRFAEALTVAGSDELGLAGKLQLVAGERPLAYTQLYAPDAAAYAAFRAELDGRTITLDDGSDAAYPDPILYPSPGLTAGNTVRVGDQVAAGLTAIVDGRGYRLQPTAPPVFGAANPRQNAPEQRDGNLRAGFLALGDYFTPNDGAFGPRGASSEAEL